MKTIGKKATKQFEKASIFCSKGNLNTGWTYVRIGARSSKMRWIDTKINAQ